MSFNRFRFWLALAAEIALFGALNFFDDWRFEAMPVKFALCGMLAGIFYFAAATTFPSAASLRTQAIIFWSVAAILRLAALPLAPTDDLRRYEWEGRIQHAGFNPYVLAPDAPELAAEAENFPAWGKINHREFGAIYPPGAELMFAGLSRVSENPLFYKILFALADLGAIAVLLRLIGGPARYAIAAWYAWNPMVAYSFAGAAHFDSVMVLTMLGAVLLIERTRTTEDSGRKWLLACAGAIALGLAISLKLVPVLLLPLCVFALGLRAVALLLSVAIPALLATCYGFPHIPIWNSLGRFAYVTRLNDLFWWLIESTVWSNPHQKNYHYNLILLAAVLLISLLFFRNWKRGLLWVMGTALILSPVLHPWYCAWILPFATWRGARAWHVLSISLFAYFLFWNERLFLLPWHSEPWLRALIIVPPITILLLSVRRSGSVIAAETAS
jgi:alpha-1,6-mannosyltransferase